MIPESKSFMTSAVLSSHNAANKQAQNYSEDLSTENVNDKLLTLPVLLIENRFHLMLAIHCSSFRHALAI